jgi:carbon monoxide dehydrogenase subunit G
MIVNTDFTVRAPADRVWAALSDLETLATSLPGSAMQRLNGDGAFHGSLRPDLGAASADCVGSLQPLDLDEDSLTASCAFRVRQADGVAFATGTLRGRVERDGDSARVLLTLDGRLAAPGVDETSAQADADRLLASIASSLEKNLAERAARAPAPAPEPEPARPAASAALRPAAAPAGAPSTPAAPIQAPRSGTVGLGLAGLVGFVLALLLGRRKRRRRVWLEIRNPW